MLHRFVSSIALVLILASPIAAWGQTQQNYATFRLTINLATSELQTDVACSRGGDCSGNGWHVVNGGEFNGYAKLTFYQDGDVQLLWQMLESKESRGYGRSDVGWPGAMRAEGKTIFDWTWSAVRTSSPEVVTPEASPTQRVLPPSPRPTFQPTRERVVDWESLPPGTELKTDHNTTLVLKFSDGSLFNLGKGAHFIKGNDPSVLGDLVDGVVRFYEVSKKVGINKAIEQKRFRVTCGPGRWCGGAVRGTEFVAGVHDNQSAYLQVLSGIVEIAGDDGTAPVQVGAGYEVTMVDGRVASAPYPFDPNAIDRWWDDGPNPALIAAIVMFAGVLYVLPLFLSIMLRVEKWWVVALVGMLAGWTIIGWVGAFVLAFTLRRRPGIQAMPFATPT